MNPESTSRRRLLQAIGALPWASVRAAQVGEASTQTIHFGVQPAAFPLAMFSELMQRDRLLAAALDRLGWRVEQHRFTKGSEMFEKLGGGRLGAAALGDIPSLNAVCEHDMLIVGLAKHTYSSVVASRYTTLTELKGKRIGNAAGSTAHYTLLEGLATVGLGEADVTLVETPVNDMPAELEAGRIDAFSAWEPAPTIALAKNPKHFVAYRGATNSYLLFNRTLAAARPEVAAEFVTAFARAYYWLKKNPDHVGLAARWSLTALAEFTGKPAALSAEQAIAITRREALDIVGLPALPKSDASAGGRLARQFAFLKQRGKLPATAQWRQVETAFAPRFIEETLRTPGKSRVFVTDYAGQGG